MFHMGTATGTASEWRHMRMGCVVFLVASLCSGAFAEDIYNGSFEIISASTPGDPYQPAEDMAEYLYLPEGWDYSNAIDYPGLNSSCTSYWSTDGDLSLCLFSLTGVDIYEGGYHSLVQLVDLTDVGGLAFDAMLEASDGGAFGPFTAYVFVTPVDTLIETRVWSANEAGEYLNQEVSVAGFTGVCYLELRLTPTVDSSSDSVQYAVFWDNLGYCDEPVTDVVGASIYLNPAVLHLGSPGKCCGPQWWGHPGRWITCFIELEEGYDATEIDGSTVCLNDIPAYLGWEWWSWAEANWWNITDINWDGVLERMVKFEYAAVEAIVAAPETTVMVSGLLLDGTPFAGTAVIRVIDNGPGKPPWPCPYVKPPLTWQWHGKAGQGGGGKTK